jgi:hypothetical protein
LPLLAIHGISEAPLSVDFWRDGLNVAFIIGKRWVRHKKKRFFPGGGKSVIALTYKILCLI